MNPSQAGQPYSPIYTGQQETWKCHAFSLKKKAMLKQTFGKQQTWKHPKKY
jgi:hypothetical protein